MLCANLKVPVVEYRDIERDDCHALFVDGLGVLAQIKTSSATVMS